AGTAIARAGLEIGSRPHCSRGAVMRSAVVVATEVVRAARRVRRMRDGLASQGAVWPVAAPPYAERVVRLRQDDAEKTKDAQPAPVVRSTEQAAPSERGAR